MAAPINYPSGAGGTTGDPLVTISPLITSGTVWYVHSGTGTDAAAPRGKERIRPLATVAQAYTNATFGDFIVCLSGHAETLTSTLTVAKTGLRILSEGTGSNRARFTCGGAIICFDITAASVMLGNLYFPASTVTPSVARVRSNIDYPTIRGCYFECGTLDTVESVRIIASTTRPEICDTSFVSTSTSVASQPESAIKIASAIGDMTMDNVVFDGGASGWSNPYAFAGDAAITRFLATNIDLLNDSDMKLATGSTFTIHIRNKSLSTRVDITP
jgi:hypothetical protein